MSLSVYCLSSHISPQLSTFNIPQTKNKKHKQKENNKKKLQYIITTDNSLLVPAMIYTYSIIRIHYLPTNLPWPNHLLCAQERTLLLRLHFPPKATQIFTIPKFHINIYSANNAGKLHVGHYNGSTAQSALKTFAGWTYIPIPPCPTCMNATTIYTYFLPHPTSQALHHYIRHKHSGLGPKNVSTGATPTPTAT
jgi:hypothetical protein